MRLRETLGAVLVLGLVQVGCSGDDKEREKTIDPGSADDSADADDSGDESDGADADGADDGADADADDTTDPDDSDTNDGEPCGGCGAGETCNPTTGECEPGPDECTCDPGSHCDDSGACVPDDEGCAETLVPGLSITGIAINQAVEIPLVEGGAEVPADDRPARVVQNRKALFRVMVTPGEGYVPTQVKAQLTLDNGGVQTKLDTTKMITDGSDESTLEGTANILVEDSALITDSTKFSVALYHTRCVDQPGNSIYPSEGLAELGAERTGRFKAVIVPYERAPYHLNVTDETLKRVKDGLYAMYPTEGVDLEVREAVPVMNQSTDLSRILQHIEGLRAEDGPSDDTYYYGMFTAADTFRGFCGDGCVAGIATLGGGGQFGDPSQRFGVGIGYLSDIETTSSGVPTTEIKISIGVMAHELGHSQGRQHAPCGGAAGTDRNFPNDDANIDTYGYSLSDGSFATPGVHTDLMGYCEPQWVSPYTYDRLATRIRGVSDQNQFVIGGAVTRHASLLIRADGRASWGDPVRRRGRPTGEEATARVYDAAGRWLRDIQVTLNQLSDHEGTLVSLPEPAANWASVEIAGQRIPVGRPEPL